MSFEILIDQLCMYGCLRAGGDTKEREKNSVGVASVSFVNRRPPISDRASGSGEGASGDRSSDTFLGVDLFVCETDEKVSLPPVLHAHVFPVSQLSIDCSVFWKQPHFRLDGLM